MSKGHMEAIAVLKARRKPILSSAALRAELGHIVIPVTDLVTKAKPGGQCPTCGCKVPKRQSAADRQRASRARKAAKA